ncbi:MAG: phospho-N-acetylmuramoyl-pentapeptide-transferase [Buchnera aphidicola (Pentalonia nigronervosa)]|jgi:phospho-N-acetylmuramoyl-pentapeptide-transferase|uniref:Phospho-N-acetylmuramoyl-pentapeptide-transferase n=1 Tax=Buchnera aphidicola (Pentalonia nigronervosa) TaxID=1309793 RepID=A0A7H1AZM7_9GAMM|nr:MAG: phospho-N-acetylmuramoyl-pentapeptide-transferase [Buchnera aphidicola (Pentalonia nigronervosa)]
MLFLLNKYLHTDLNISIYIPYRSILSLLTSFFTSLYIVPHFISYSNNLKIHQTIRQNGPKTHFTKNRIPTMGGLLIIFSIIFSTILYCDLRNTNIWYVINVLIAYGSIGFIDDYLKIRYNNSQGLKILHKYIYLSIIALGTVYVIYVNNPNFFTSTFIIPFFHPITLKTPYLYILLSYFVIIGTSNAVNLTDGLDGLAIMPIIFLTSSFALISILSSNISNLHYLNIIYLQNAAELTVLCSAMIGSGFGFLWFNAYPAKIFMGDVGSLSLGGALGTITILLHQELLLIIMGGIFVIEALSVILQIISFQLLKKKIFKMAPIHHHYEIKGMLEPTIIIRFWIVSLMLVLIGLISIRIC